MKDPLPCALGLLLQQRCALLVQVASRLGYIRKHNDGASTRSLYRSYCIDIPTIIMNRPYTSTC